MDGEVRHAEVGADGAIGTFVEDHGIDFVAFGMNAHSTRTHKSVSRSHCRMENQASRACGRGPVLSNSWKFRKMVDEK